MAYFDPQAKTYKTLRSERLEFSASGSATGAPLVEASGLKVLGTDIGYIKPDAAALTVTPMDPPWWPNLLYLFSFGMVGARSGIARTRAAAVGSRLRAQVALVVAGEAPAAGGGDAAQEERREGIPRGVGAGRHGLRRRPLQRRRAGNDEGPAALDPDRLAVPADTSAALLEIIDQCEIARFSPGMLGPGDPRQLFERARDVLGRI